jgi:hypothetical protein
MNRTRIAALAVAVLALAGCGGTAATTGTGSPAATAASAPQQAGSEPGGFPSSAVANPVPILKMTGVPVPAGVVNGTIGIDANRVAGASFPGPSGETVWVFTYPSAAYRDYRLAHPLTPPSDGQYKIRGPGASIVTVDRSPGFTGPTPQQIAARVHGTLYVVADNGSAS